MTEKDLLKNKKLFRKKFPNFLEIELQDPSIEILRYPKYNIIGMYFPEHIQTIPASELRILLSIPEFLYVHNKTTPLVTDDGTDDGYEVRLGYVFSIPKIKSTMKIIAS